MKLTNVHYEYRGNDIWRIYFKDYQEADSFRNERIYGNKPTYFAICTDNLGVRYYVEAKLTGQFSILRHYAKDFSNDAWRALVKKIEGADTDYIFDEIDLWYVATTDKCYFKICCMSGTWTEPFVKNMLNACEYCKREADIAEEFIAATLKAKDSTAEPLIFFNNKVMTLAEFNAFIKDTQEKEANNKEDNNMKIYWDESQPRIENVRDIVLRSYKCDRSVYYYRVYFESVVDAKNVMECSYYQDKNKHCWYYMMIASTAELRKEMEGSIKTLYLTYDKYKKEYYINWKAMYETPLKANAHFEMKMTAQLNDEQLKVWEAALGIGNQPKHKKEKTVGDVVNEFTEEQKKVLYYLIAEAQKSGKAENPKPTKILVQGTATIIWWSDGTKTIVKCQKGDEMDPEKGIAMCVMKKFMGTNETHSNYLDFAKDAIAEYEKKQAVEKAKKKAEVDKKRRAAAKKKGADGNANYKRTTKKHPIETLSDAITALARETNADKEES